MYCWLFRNDPSLRSKTVINKKKEESLHLKISQKYWGEIWGKNKTKIR